MSDRDRPRQPGLRPSRSGATRDNTSDGPPDATTAPRQPANGSGRLRQNRDRDPSSDDSADEAFPSDTSPSVAPSAHVQATDDRKYRGKPRLERADNSLSLCNGESPCHCAALLGPAQTPPVRGGAGLRTEEIRALPAAFAFDPVVPAAFGISRSAAYRALAAGELPIRTLRLGRKLIVTRADLMAALGIRDVQRSPAVGSDNEGNRTDLLVPDCGDANLEGDR